MMIVQNRTRIYTGAIALTAITLGGLGAWLWPPTKQTQHPWLPPTLAATMDAVGFETRINFKQRYGLLNHMHWMATGEPQDDPREARKWLRPVPEQHPLAPPLNREWRKLDHHYRISLEGLQATDSIFAIGARRQK